MHAAQQTTLAGGTLRLHHPPPMVAMIVGLAGCGFLFLGLPFGQVPPSLADAPAATAQAPAHRPHLSVPLVPVVSGDVR
ncbi:hypothetical protein ACIHFB_30115 [Streptomyces sp. NPDC051963]|uniref:hypothetical protein n=1 Tax=Streptomyces sp. NPDC051963 TaxID=3365678 RepID=UPI0037D22DE0